MKTYLAKPKEITQKWYILDATDKILGRAAVKIADTLRGKNKVTFTPQTDAGDHVIVINAEKIKLTGNKLDQKVYFRHSGYKGGLKTIVARKMLEDKPTFLIEEAVRNMLPANRLRSGFMTKLKIYAGDKHPHVAQNPTPLEI